MHQQNFVPLGRHFLDPGAVGLIKVSIEEVASEQKGGDRIYRLPAVTAYLDFRHAAPKYLSNGYEEPANAHERAQELLNDCGAAHFVALDDCTWVRADLVRTFTVDGRQIQTWLDFQASTPYVAVTNLPGSFGRITADIARARRVIETDIADGIRSC